MPFLQDLSPEEIAEALAQAAQDNRPLALTVRYQSRWVTFRSYAIADYKFFLWAEMPKTDHLPAPYEFRIGSQVGVTFNIENRKYVCAAEVVGSETYSIREDLSCTALKLAVPRKMHRVERRLHDRVEVAQDEISRATFWLGGIDARPEEGSTEEPVWAGRVINLSSGGVLVRTTCEAAKFLEAGDIVGVHILFRSQDQAAFLDAQLRHCHRDNEMAMLGFQFIEPDATGTADQAVLRLVRGKIEQRQEAQAVHA